MSGSMISFETVPALGTVVMLDEQPFTLIASEAYTRRDGGLSTLLIWSVACAECGETFESKSPMVTSGLTRRCVDHSKVGRPVSGKRGPGRKIAVRIIPPETAQETSK